MFNDLRTQMHNELDNILNVLEAEGVTPECPQIEVRDTRTLDEGDNITIYSVGAELTVNALDIAQTEDRYLSVKYQITQWLNKKQFKTTTINARRETL
jgi:hypothetical protein